ncbi:MAG: hypothetical protein EAX87_01190 [Candidatus Thorarchaeota archaeon]|nr:hypothetical protein [Candidatus Thorarchaeota archaeon]
MTPYDLNSRIKYPQTPEKWRRWILLNLGIDEAQGREMINDDTFPFGDLIQAWEQKFTVEHGFSPSFIPALSRNKRGFVMWVFLEAPEPNWTKSDVEGNH